MLYNTFLPILLAAPLALAAQSTPRLKGLVPSSLHARQTASDCASQGYAVCDNGCMPLASVCCHDGNADYCDLGNVCNADGCCPIGETCVGGGGTQTIDLPGATGVPEPSTTADSVPVPTFTDSTPVPTQSSDPIVTESQNPTTRATGSSPAATSSSGGCTGTMTTCGTSCMPSGATCCSSGVWCAAGKQCGPSGGCLASSSSSSSTKSSAAARSWMMDSMAVGLAGLAAMGFFLIR
jgi:hypothetical protein